MKDAPANSRMHWHVPAGHHPSAFLLGAQLLSLVLHGVFETISSGRALLSAIGGLILWLTVWVVKRSPGLNWIAWVLVIPAFLLSVMSALIDHAMLLMWSSLFEAALYFYGAGSLIAYMMEDRQVTTDELFASGATFTLLAWAFAYMYQVCQMVFPGCFSGGSMPGQYRSFLELLFLSFANLSSVGLSDILPIASPARVLVMLEQFAGVAYIAVVVSRLIGMTIVFHKRKK